jgi:hypothetical protein
MSWDDFSSYYFDFEFGQGEDDPKFPPDSPFVPTSIRSEHPADRIDAAAASVWADTRNIPQTVSGADAYDTLAALYFSLQRSLVAHCVRSTFTKTECRIFLKALCGIETTERAQRGLHRYITDGLRRAMANVASFPLQILKDAAKKCALEVGHSTDKMSVRCRLTEE